MREKERKREFFIGVFVCIEKVFGVPNFDKLCPFDLRVSDCLNPGACCKYLLAKHIFNPQSKSKCTILCKHKPKPFCGLFA